MKIIKHLKVPTGDILVVEGENGKLEMLSLGDYGQQVNLNQNKPVPNGLPLLPLTEKWVITISTQYGCGMGCTFCDVPKVGSGINATKKDLIDQVQAGLDLHPEITGTKRLNIHFARMGEPSFNNDVIYAAREFIANPLWTQKFNVHPVVSTMMPRQSEGRLKDFIVSWMDVKNNYYQGNAGLQLSINSTNEMQRHRMFRGHSLMLWEIADIMKNIPKPVGRKITLNFAVADYDVDPLILLRHFNPKHYICKLTPMHKTEAAIKNDIETEGDYTTPEPYNEIEYELKKVGYDVLVFIASKDEDEGRITCGNAILSGTLPHKFEEINNQ
jgi:23S rRNA (adenine2503-C2)-methyltransferase